MRVAGHVLHLEQAVLLVVDHINLAGRRVVRCDGGHRDDWHLQVMRHSLAHVDAFATPCRDDHIGLQETRGCDKPIDLGGCDLSRKQQGRDITTAHREAETRQGTQG